MNLIVRGKATLGKSLPCRSYAMAWHAYLQGGVVSHHQVRIIREFMNANCGRSKRQDDAAEDSTARNRECPPNELALARLHQILDDLGTGTANVKCKRQSAQQNKEEDSSDEGDKPRHSEQMHNALCTTT